MTYLEVKFKSLKNENTGTLETFCCSNKHEKALKNTGLKILMQKISLNAK